MGFATEGPSYVNPRIQNHTGGLQVHTNPFVGVVFCGFSCFLKRMALMIINTDVCFLRLVVLAIKPQQTKYPTSRYPGPKVSCDPKYTIVPFEKAIISCLLIITPSTSPWPASCCGSGAWASEPCE